MSTSSAPGPEKGRDGIKEKGRHRKREIDWKERGKRGWTLPLMKF